MNRTFPRLLSLVLATGFSCATAHALTETDQSSNGSGSSFDGDISSTDLLESATLTGAVYTHSETSPQGGHQAGDAATGDNGFSLTGINDGTASDAVSSTSGTTLFAQGQLGQGLLAAPQLTYTLSTASPLGYTITSINSINGYGAGYAAELADQDYKVEYALVGSSTFLTLATVDYEPFTSPSDNGDPSSNNGSSEVTLTNLGLGGAGVAGVGALRFTYFVPASETGVQIGQLIREIDVHGVPTVATPEPSTYAMLFAGLGALAIAVRLRRLA